MSVNSGSTRKRNKKTSKSSGSAPPAGAPLLVDPRLNSINFVLAEGKNLRVLKVEHQDEDEAFLHVQDDEDAAKGAKEREGGDLETGATESSSSSPLPPSDGNQRATRSLICDPVVERMRRRCLCRKGESRRGRKTPEDVKHRIGLFSCLILLIGFVSVALILTLGLMAARKDQEKEFTQEASEVTNQFSMASNDISRAGLWINQDASRHIVHTPGEETGHLHQRRMRYAMDGWVDEASREDFHELYRSLVFSNVAATEVGYALNVSHADRVKMEEETRTFIQARSDVEASNYQGFMGYNRSMGDQSELVTPFQRISPRPEMSHYFVQHVLEPFSSNSSSLDFDLMSIPVVAEAVSRAMSTWESTVTPPFCSGDRGRYGLMFFHPGVPPRQISAQSNVMSHEQYQRPPGLSVLRVPVPELFKHVNSEYSVEKPIRLLAYDSTEGNHLQLGVAQFRPVASRSRSTQDENPKRRLEQEETDGMVFDCDLVAYNDIKRDDYKYYTERQIHIASRTWTFVFVATEDDYPLDYTFIAIGASMIFVACLFLTLWLYTDYQRMVKIGQVQAASDAEKAALKVKNAQVTARTERELNDFIAHEVRNPLSAALSACSFVSSALREEPPLSSPEKKQEVEDDVVVIENSLHFINDLLRNMLDLHKTNSNQLKLNPTPTSVLSDILQPVASMLYKRGENFTVHVECNPPDMVIMADTLRLKQIVLNLGRNAVKFVEKGFVRLRATQNDSGNVCIFIEDSGPGIPVEKRGKLFNKFQESLDSLHQGTGIGLAVCRKLIDLMGGEIGLNESYHSGIQGCPGACFIINLNTPIITISDEDLEKQEDGQGLDGTKRTVSPTVNSATGTGSSVPTIAGKQDSYRESAELPENLSVLFVDDDMMVRKLFMRSLKRVSPSWDIKEASNGETGLQMAEAENFQLIFLDQYMASVDKQMLGTETAMAMRAAGIKATICGLSANDMEKSFLASGANAFMMKPFPCAPKELKAELLKILGCSHHNHHHPDDTTPKTVSMPELPSQQRERETTERLHDEF